MMSNNNNTLLILYGSLLLLLTSYVVYGTESDTITKSLIKSSCTTTLYPDICYSTLSPVTRNLLTKKDVIELTITRTKKTIQANLHTINNLMETPNLSTRAKIALNDCLQMVDGTLQQLDTVIQELKTYPNKKSIRHHANDLKTLMSTTITNKETCLDSLSHNDASSKHLRKAIVQGQEHGGKMCSNVLAMIKDMTDKDIANDNNNNNFNILNFNFNKEVIMWPEWLSAGDRKLLESEDVTPNVNVAADGTGDYTSVADAVAAAPKSNSRYVIKIKAGVYRENVTIPSGKPYLMFIGDGRGNTIITASKSCAGTNATTFDSATVAADGNGFLARDITFQNAAGPSGEQAVALRVGSDKSAFYRCGIIAYQDTLYVHSNRQFFVNCFIAGTVDFIFGNAAVVLQNCDIKPRLPGPKQKNMVTAQGRTDVNQNTGIVIQKCKITADDDLLPVQDSYPSYLGRPWKEHSRTVVMQSSISDVIDPAGWYPWKDDFALDTLYYREYQNTGPGADTSNRVSWPGWGVITDPAEAESFTAGNFIDGGSWLPSTGFPYSLGL